MQFYDPKMEMIRVAYHGVKIHGHAAVTTNFRMEGEGVVEWREGRRDGGIDGEKWREHLLSGCFSFGVMERMKSCGVMYTSASPCSLMIFSVAK